MSEQAEAVIVGAGFAGVSTAYWLARAGARRVVVLERESTPGAHASGRNAALAFQVLSDLAEARLAVEGARFIADPPAGFCEHPLLAARGSLLVADDSRTADLRRSLDRARALGLDAEVLSAEAARARVPILAGGPLAAAFWTPSDGVVDIHALLQGYLAAARREGVSVAYGEPVVAIDTAGARVARVRTARREIHTPVVVNAAGAWAGEIGSLAGVGPRTLAPRRRHLFQTDIARPIDPAWPFVWHNDVDVYFRPESGGLLMSPCDATPHPAAAPGVDDGAAELLHEKLTRAFPSLAEAVVRSRWACLRTFAADERFVIGPDPELHGLVWVAGLGGHGMTTSPAVGRLGALAARGEHSEELRPFLPARLGAATGAAPAAGSRDA